MTNQVNEHLNTGLHPRSVVNPLDEMGEGDPISPYYRDDWNEDVPLPPDDTPQIIEGEVDLEGKGRDWAREVPSMEPCPVCDFAQGAHDPAGNCPTEMQARMWYGQ